jgi:GTP-binding protein
MEIKEAKFVMSNSDYRDCPKVPMPEVAFIGRSNVGKSSLINYLCNNKKLAKTSSTPGKTQLINHFLINNNWHLVDLPGYGYAKVSKKQRAVFEQMINKFLLNREFLLNTFVLIDARLKPQLIDLEFINYLGENHIPFSIVFTKSDKLKPLELKKNVIAFKAEMEKTWEELPPCYISSSEKKIGKKDILDSIELIIAEFKY